MLKLQGFKNILAGITIPNPKSIGFHQDFGFQFFARYENVGFKFNEWRSTEWYRISILNNEEKPNPLIPISEILDRKEWKGIMEEAVQIIKR